MESDHASTGNGGGNPNRHQVSTVAMVAVTTLAIYLCYLILQPFLPSLVWAVALAVLSQPLFRRLDRLFGNRTAAAGFTVAVVALVVIVPLYLVGRQTVVEVLRNFDYVRGIVEGGGWRAAFAGSASASDALAWVEANLSLDEGIRQLLALLPALASRLLSGSALATLELLFVFFSLFFLLRDSATLVAGVRAMLPLSAAETDKVFRRVEDTVFATVFGEVLISAVTGALGAFVFWALGFKAAVTWGFIMAILAFLPAVGTWAVWLPAAVFLFIEDRWGAGLVLVAWGVAVMTVLTSFLYPKLVGHRLRLHTLLVFISIIGGISVFGTVGVVAGPLVLALAISLFEIWTQRLGKVREGSA